MRSHSESRGRAATAVWVVCLECRKSQAVSTRQGFARFDEAHRRRCGESANVTAMFGNLEELFDLPAS
jgi:hypothetical protein